MAPDPGLVTHAHRRRAILAACLALALPCLCPVLARAARPLSLGFSDGQFVEPDAATWFGRSVSAGADWARINIGWVAPDTPTMPADFDPRNPADPNYDFTGGDAAIREATADGLKVLIVFNGAPQWAEGPGMPAGTEPGSWRPSPQAVEDYGVALATRYSGHFPDPLHPGQMLPRVAAFQLWNEPNLNKYLTPQWSGNKPEAPVIYRAMLNAFYRGVKSVDPSALVVTAGTAPFGDPEPGGQRIMPALFWRALLCVREVGRSLRGTSCPDPAHFDVLSHHPYSVGEPDTPADNADDVSIPDIGKLTRILRFAERTGRALPHIHHAVWITEVGYNTSPPNPGGVPVNEDAHWVEQTLALLWRQDVDTIFWSDLVDQPPVPSYSETSQAGVFYLDGQPKPSLLAFQFPLVAWRAHGSVEVWGRAPVAGAVKVERQVGSSWQTLRVLDVAKQATFLTNVTQKSGANFRAVLAGEVSLVWRLG